MSSCRKTSRPALIIAFLVTAAQPCPAQQDDPVELQVRPDYRLLEAGDQPDGLRFRARSKPANLFKAAGRKHLPRRLPALTRPTPPPARAWQLPRATRTGRHRQN